MQVTNGGDLVNPERDNKKAVILGVGLLILLGITFNFMSNNILSDAEDELSKTSPDEFGYKNKLNSLNQTRQWSRTLNIMGNSIIIFGIFLFLICIYFDFDDKFGQLEKKMIYIINTIEKDTKK
jgi:ABC-type transport system involved in multi-copper enzyme maturation permease subunit